MTGRIALPWRREVYWASSRVANRTAAASPLQVSGALHQGGTVHAPGRATPAMAPPPPGRTARVARPLRSARAELQGAGAPAMHQNGARESAPRGLFGLAPANSLCGAAMKEILPTDSV